MKVAQENQFGVGAFNIASVCFARLVIEGGGIPAIPVILEVHPDEHAFVGDSFIAYLGSWRLRFRAGGDSSGSRPDAGAYFNRHPHRLYLGHDRCLRLAI